MREFLTGVTYLGRGIGWVVKRPGWWLFGLIPAFAVMIVYAVGLIFLALHSVDLAQWMTPFADDWSYERALRISIALVIVASGTFFALITFTSVTLLLGEPFYEKITTKVEESAGGALPEPDVSLWRQISRSAGDAVITALAAGSFSAAFFALGFVPVLGQTVVPVLATAVMGSFLARELTSTPLERRGLRRRERIALLRRHRGLSMGFGVATVVVFLIPVGAVVFMPAAVAGATLLTRERLAGPDIHSGSST